MTHPLPYNGIWDDAQLWADSLVWRDAPDAIPPHRGAWKGNPANPVPNFVQKSKLLSEKKVSVNRAYQTRRDTDTQKDVTVKLIDVDTAIMKQLERFQLNVIDEGNRIKVPVFYASPEKWKSIQKDGFLRDYNGKIQLPVVVFQRTTSDKDQALLMFNRYLKYPVMKMYSEKNPLSTSIAIQKIPCMEQSIILIQMFPR